MQPPARSTTGHSCGGVDGYTPWHADTSLVTCSDLDNTASMFSYLDKLHLRTHACAGRCAGAIYTNACLPTPYARTPNAFLPCAAPATTCSITFVVAPHTLRDCRARCGRRICSTPRAPIPLLPRCTSPDSTFTIRSFHTAYLFCDRYGEPRRVFCRDASGPRAHHRPPRLLLPTPGAYCLAAPPVVRASTTAPRVAGWRHATTWTWTWRRAARAR